VEIVVEARGPDVAVIRTTGRLDLGSAAAVRECLRAAVAAGQRHLVVDLAATTFIDSTGLRALVDGLTAARRAGGDVRLARPNVQARLILEYTALDRVLRPYDTVEQALDGR
jgi:anti-anti-sigma factor